MTTNYELFTHYQTIRLVHGESINTLLNERILALSKLTAFADDKFKVAQMVQFLIDMEEKKFLEKKKMSSTLYHTVLTYNDSKEDSFGQHCGIRRKCW